MSGPMGAPVPWAKKIRAKGEAMNSRDLNNWGLVVAMAVILAVLIAAVVGR